MQDKIILKLGGSLLYDLSLSLNLEFLNKFQAWFKEAKKDYSRIVIIVGGGKLSRHLVGQVIPFMSTENSQHRVGMAITNTNAEILRSLLGEDSIMVPKTLGQALEMVVDDGPKYVVTGGFKEGWSTDMDSVVLAHILGIKKVHKLSNIDHIYTADPSKDPTATIIKDITWEDYFRTFGLTAGNITHRPGQNIPIGVLAARFASQKGISFFVSGGSTIDEQPSLSSVLESGTFVHP